MKLIHRILLCLSAAALALSLAACASHPASSSDPSEPETPPDAYSLYTAAFTKTIEEKNLSLSMDLKLTAESAGTAMEMGMKMSVAQILSGNDPRLRVDTTLSLLGQDVTQMMYFERGMLYYQSSADQKFRQAMDLSDAESQVAEESWLFEIPESAMRDATVTGTKEVGYAVTVTLSAADIRQQLMKMLSSAYGAEAGAQEDGEAAQEITFTDPRFQFTVDADGYLSSYSMTLEATGERDTVGEDGEPATAVTAMKLEAGVSDLLTGKLVHVVMPDDLDTYPEPARQLTEEEQKEILAALTNDDGSPVSNFNEVYAQLVEKYGQATMKAYFSGL